MSTFIGYTFVIYRYEDGYEITKSFQKRIEVFETVKFTLDSALSLIQEHEGRLYEVKIRQQSHEPKWSSIEEYIRTKEYKREELNFIAKLKDSDYPDYLISILPSYLYYYRNM